MGISAYARIALADGSAVRAEDVAPGAVLLNPLNGGTLTVKKVWQGPGVGMVRIGAADGALVDLTGDQRLATAAGPLPASDIRPGTVLVSVQGHIACSEAGTIMGDYMVYDIIPEPAAVSAVAANGIVVFLG